MKKLMILCAAVAFAASAMAQTPASDSKDVNCGSSVKIKAEPKAGFHFVQWADDANAPAERTISNIKEAKNFKAIFAANETNFGDDVAIVPATPEVGQSVTLTATPSDDCQEFVRWSDGNTDNPRTFTYDGTVPFTAVYQTKVFTVTATADDNTQGSVSVTVQ